MADKLFDKKLEARRRDAEAVKEEINTSKKGNTKMENEKKEVIKISKGKYIGMIIAVWTAAILAVVLAGVSVYYLAYHHGYNDRVSDAKVLSSAVEAQLKTKQ